MWFWQLQWLFVCFVDEDSAEANARGAEVGGERA
jgi:hypothetical protein